MATGLRYRQGVVTGLRRLIEKTLLPKSMRHEAVGPDRMVDPERTTISACCATVVARRRERCADISPQVVLANAWQRGSCRMQFAGVAAAGSGMPSAIATARRATASAAR